MANLQQCAQILTEKEILQDGLINQKHMTSAYNTYAGECANQQLRAAMLSILEDEHKIQADIFSEMQANGWYKLEQAQQDKIAEVKQKVTSGN